MPVNLNGFEIEHPLDEYQNAVGATAALLWGKGSSTAPMADAGIASKNWISLWTKTTSTSGDSRVMYLRQFWNGASGGEVIRAWATANTTSVATAGTMNAIHATASIAASCSVSGALNALRATISAAASATMGGTGAAIQLDSDIATGLSVPASWAFMRVTDSGATGLKTLLNVPAASAGGLLATHTTDAMTHSVKCITSGGTVFYLMATTTATNRS